MCFGTTGATIVWRRAHRKNTQGDGDCVMGLLTCLSEFLGAHGGRMWSTKLCVRNSLGSRPQLMRVFDSAFPRRAAVTICILEVVHHKHACGSSLTGKTEMCHVRQSASVGMERVQTLPQNLHFGDPSPNRRIKKKKRNSVAFESLRSHLRLWKATHHEHLGNAWNKWRWVFLCTRSS